MRRSRLPLSCKSSEAALLELLAAATRARIVATDVAKRIDRRLWHVRTERCTLKPGILLRIVRMGHPIEFGQQILDVTEPFVREPAQVLRVGFRSPQHLLEPFRTADLLRYPPVAEGGLDALSHLPEAEQSDGFPPALPGEVARHGQALVVE